MNCYTTFDRASHTFFVDVIPQEEWNKKFEVTIMKGFVVSNMMLHYSL